MFENAVEGIFQTTQEGVLVSANPRMVTMLGYDSIEDLNGNIQNFYVDICILSRDIKKFFDLIHKNPTVTGFETRFKRKDNSHIWVSLSARAIYDNTGKIILIEGIIIDITEQKQEFIALHEREAYLRKENIQLKNTIKDCYRFGEIIGKSDAMHKVYNMILKASNQKANVII
ncbi:MAG: PAS domain-containing protein [Desulfobacterales bacterium]|nr:PAS domain-containing protein [Desulfobacterales bacterium]